MRALNRKEKKNRYQTGEKNVAAEIKNKTSPKPICLFIILTMRLLFKLKYKLSRSNSIETNKKLIEKLKAKIYTSVCITLYKTERIKSSGNKNQEILRNTKSCQAIMPSKLINISSSTISILVNPLHLHSGFRLG